jgi:hypothetical protein
MKQQHQCKIYFGKKKLKMRDKIKYEVKVYSGQNELKNEKNKRQSEANSGKK